MFNLIRAQWQCDEKTLSTVPSIQEISNNNNSNSTQVHSHHRYDTLLHYFSSFITDFKIHLVDLKHVVYQIVGLDPMQVCVLEQPPGYQTCEACQVQFMMYSCRKAKQDIVRVIALLKGLNQSKQYSFIPFSNPIFNNENLQKNIRNDESECKINNFANKQNVNINQIGFLTFRETKNQQIETKLERDWSQQFRIEQHLNQTSFSHLQNDDQNDIDKENSEQIQDNQQQMQLQKQTQQTQDSQQYFLKAFNLLKLIKKEVQQIQNKSISIKITQTPSPSPPSSQLKAEQPQIDQQIN